jgi:hypothetical protein
VIAVLAVVTQAGAEGVQGPQDLGVASQQACHQHRQEGDHDGFGRDEDYQGPEPRCRQALVEAAAPRPLTPFSMLPVMPGKVFGAPGSHNLAPTGWPGLMRLVVAPMTSR